MLLSELLQVNDISPAENLRVTGLTADSREVKPGYIFAALKGSASDGRQFIGAAVERGAIAVLMDQGEAAHDCPVYCIESDNPRRKLALIAARFYADQPATMIAVTGTNGKTSVAHFVRSIWQALGLKAASLGTLGIVTGDGTAPLHYTSPEPVLLQQKLKELADAGVTHGALEASSHGLDQYRMDGVAVKVGAFTNLTRDHLDYHENSEAYLKAKIGLVSRVVDAEGAVVLNADSDVFEDFQHAAEDRNLKVISYGHKGRDLQLKSTRSHAAGQQVQAVIFGSELTLDLPLAGEFQAMNILCAMGIVIAAGAKADAVIGVLSKLENVPGRMELVATLPTGASVYVDFAHTPDALETVLKSLRPHADNKIHALVGCGGDRDTGKRPVMGAIADRLADVVYITDDNPRSEEPAAIRAEIMTACPNAIEIGDRKHAIETAMRAAKTGDIVLIAGKGHEDGQIIGDQVVPFNDKRVAMDIAATLREVS